MSRPSVDALLAAAAMNPPPIETTGAWRLLNDELGPQFPHYATDCPQWACPHVSVEDRRDGEVCTICSPCDCTPVPQNSEEKKQ